LTAERWAQIKEIFQAALERPISGRGAFLEEACRGDGALRQEVESLLAGQDSSSLASPAEELLNHIAAAELAAGQSLAHYRVEAKLGEGGMGAVYRAYDTKLRRQVALKVLPPERLADSESRQRLLREARTASALNHPNIVTVHEIGSEAGIDFIAMEYMAGKTLDQVIPRKGLRLSEALKYAVQVADALTAAHAAGIVHRDIKPANIMVDEHGIAKVLDFGLAKLTEPLESAERTDTLKPRTEEGAIVGTAAYMSPEQAAGKKVDARSDIFSFGAVLYEMVSGRRAFHGDSKLSTLAAILDQEPAPLPTGIPHDLEKLISRCLRKDPQRRFQHMDDVKIALEELKEESDSGKLATVAPRVGRRGRRYWRWAAGLGVFLLLAAAGLWLWQSRAKVPTAAFEVVPLTTYPGNQTEPSFSSDGNQVAFVWDGPRQDNTDIYVKQIGTESLLRLTSDPAVELGPAWSPDGRYIAFLRLLSDDRAGVFLVPAIGGPELKLAETRQSGNDLFLHHLGWSPDGKWLAISDRSSADEPLSLFLLSIETGEKRRLTFPLAGGPYDGDGAPAFSPDGRSIVFVRGATLGCRWRRKTGPFSRDGNRPVCGLPFGLQ
jgi:serine/threonine protein kinase